jgi:hypothetical protein
MGKPISDARGRDVPRAAAGTVGVNCFFIRDLRAPFGGVGDSGIGREGGTFLCWPPPWASSTSGPRPGLDRAAAAGDQSTPGCPRP